MAKVGYEPFFTEESYIKYSVFPSFLDFIKQKDVEINGQLAPKSESPSIAKKSNLKPKGSSSEWKNILCQKKKKPDRINVPYLYPEVPFPRLSLLTKEDMKKFFELMEKYGSPCRPGGQGSDHKEIIMLRDLQAKVLAEQTEYLKYLQFASCKLHQNYQHISDTADSYVTDMLESRARRVLRYPQFYVQHDSVPLHTAKLVREVPFFHIKTLLNLGKVPEFVPVCVSKKALKNKLQCDPKKLRKAIPPDSSEEKDKQVCSEDKNAETLALKHRVQVVITSSALNCLVDNHEPYQRQWEIPVVIREMHEKLESGQSHTYKVVYIDKPFVQKHMTVRERSHSFHKVSLKYGYSHADHAGTFMKVPDPTGNDIEFKYKEDARNQINESYEEANFLEESVGKSLLSPEIEDLETFGTGPSKKTKLSFLEELKNKKKPGFKIHGNKTERVLETGVEGVENTGSKVDDSQILRTEKLEELTSSDGMEIEEIESGNQESLIKKEVDKNSSKEDNKDVLEDSGTMEIVQDDTKAELKNDKLNESNKFGNSSDGVKGMDTDSMEDNDDKVAEAGKENSGDKQNKQVLLSQGASTCSESESDALVIESDEESALQIDVPQCDGSGDEENDGIPQYDGPTETKRSKKQGKPSKQKPVKQGPIETKTRKTGKNVKLVTGKSGQVNDAGKKGKTKVRKLALKKDENVQDSQEKIELSKETSKSVLKKVKVVPKGLMKTYAERKYGLKRRKVSLTAKKTLRMRKQEHPQLPRIAGEECELDMLVNTIDGESVIMETEHQEDVPAVSKMETGREKRRRSSNRRSRAFIESNMVNMEDEQGASGLSKKQGKLSSIKPKDDEGKQMLKDAAIEDVGRGKTGKGRRKSARGSVAMAKEVDDFDDTLLVEEGVDISQEFIDIDADSTGDCKFVMGEGILVGQDAGDGLMQKDNGNSPILHTQKSSEQNNTLDTIKTENDADIITVKVEPKELETQPVKNKKRGRPSKKSLEQKVVLPRKNTRRSASMDESSCAIVKEEVDFVNENQTGKVTECATTVVGNIDVLPGQKRKRGRPKKNQTESVDTTVVKSEVVSMADGILEEGMAAGITNETLSGKPQKTARRNTRTRRSLPAEILSSNTSGILLAESVGTLDNKPLESSTELNSECKEIQTVGVSKRKRGRKSLVRSVTEIVTLDRNISEGDGNKVKEMPQQQRRTRSQLRSLSQDSSDLESKVTESKKTERKSMSRSTQKEVSGEMDVNTPGVPEVAESNEGKMTGTGNDAEDATAVSDQDTEPDLQIDETEALEGVHLEELEEDLDLSATESGSDIEEIGSPSGKKKKPHRLYFSDEDSEEEERRRAQKAQKNWIDSVRQPVKTSQPVRRDSDPKEGDTTKKVDTEESTETAKKPAIKVKSGTKKLFEDLDSMPTNKPARRNLPIIRRKIQSLPKYKPQAEEFDNATSVPDYFAEIETLSHQTGKMGKHPAKPKHQMSSQTSINLQLKQRIMRRRMISNKLGKKESETTKIESKTETKRKIEQIKIPEIQEPDEVVLNEANEPVSFISAPESPTEHCKVHNPPLSPTPERVSTLTPNTRMEKLKGPKIIPLEKDTSAATSYAMEFNEQQQLQIEANMEPNRSGISQLKLGIPIGIKPLSNPDHTFSPIASEGYNINVHEGITENYIPDTQPVEDIHEFNEMSAKEPSISSVNTPPVVQRQLSVNTGQGRVKSGDYKSNISSDGLIIPTQRKTRVSLVAEGSSLYREHTSSDKLSLSAKTSQAKEGKVIKTRSRTKYVQGQTGLGILDRLLPVKKDTSAGQEKLQGQGSSHIHYSPQSQMAASVGQVDLQRQYSANADNTHVYGQMGKPVVPQGSNIDQSQGATRGGRTTSVDSHSIPPVLSQLGTEPSAMATGNTPERVGTIIAQGVVQLPPNTGMHHIQTGKEQHVTQGQGHDNLKPHGPHDQHVAIGQNLQRQQHVIQGQGQTSQRHPGQGDQHVIQGQGLHSRGHIREQIASPGREVPPFVRHPHHPANQTHFYQAPHHIRDPKEWEMYEDPGEFACPARGNLTYNLWQLGKFRVLVRCRLHAVKSQAARDSKVNFLHFHPKLEYQRYHGYEQHTLSEISRSWINLAIRPRCNLYRVRIASKTSEVLTEEELDITQVLGSSNNFSPKSSLDVLEGVFNKLCSLQPGHYLLGHAPGNTQAHIKKTTQSQVGVYNLHVAYNNLRIDRDTVPWIPVDPSVKLPFHTYHNRVPCTFEPKDTDKPFFKSHQDDKKFKGKKNRKKGNKGAKK